MSSSGPDFGSNVDEPTRTSAAVHGGCSRPREVCSSELLQESDRLFIHHEGQCYTLRMTSSRKLILTK